MTKRTKIITVGLCVALSSLFLGLVGTILLNNWFEHNRLVFHSPIEVAFFQPVKVEERKPEVVKEVVTLEFPEDIDTPIEKYICDKFGPYYCRIALAIVKAESNFNELAIHINDNSSVDLGCWQINFPLHKGTISPKDAFDCYKATDWAYAKFKRDGNFNAWVGFVNGNFKSHL